ncbi:hypothetical protein BV22DRAFT_986662, partial [Leucogyrophana mollusca]
PKHYRIISPAWRSDEFTIFLHRLDHIYRQDWRCPLGGKRATAGNPPRTRIQSTRSNPGLAPKHLPRNCYNPTWLLSLRPWQTKRLGVVEEDYNFDID